MRRNGKLIVLVVSFAMVAASPDLAGRARTAATAPAGAPATASAPARPAEVRWHGTHAAAAADARKRKALLLVIYTDPSVAACEEFERQTLARPSIRRLLGALAAVKLNVNAGEGKQRFAGTSGRETPLTRIFTPAGELLDSIPGCIIPASAFAARLAPSLAYHRAATSRPANARARWDAVRARLKLSTCEKAAAEIDALAKLPAARRPRGLTLARLRLAKGRAMRSHPAAARRLFAEARGLAGAEPAVAAGALVELARLEERDGRHKRAHRLYGEYVKAFPAGADAGRCLYHKAILEFQALGEKAGAIRTLEGLVKKYPDDEYASRARALKKMLGPVKPRKPVTTRSVTTKRIEIRKID